MLRLCFLKKVAKLLLNCDHTHIKCVQTGNYREEKYPRILLGYFLFNFVFSAANLLVNFVSCHPVL